MLADTPAAQWRDYLAFHTIDDASQSLSKPFQDENFAFYGQTLNGQPEQRARWKRVLEAVNGGMGEALGQLYVKDYFPPEAKARAQSLVDNVRNALKARIEHLDWMSDETKAKALEKWSDLPAEDRLSGQVARLGRPGHRAGRLLRQPARGQRVQQPLRPGQDRQADRSLRMGHDPADGQCVLQLRHQHDQLPGRDPAAAVLLCQRRRRDQLRRHRCGDRP